MMNDSIVSEAVGLLKRGGVVVFPTDTVWGVGAAISSREGIEKLYRVKGREKDKPSQVLVSDVNMANRYGVMDKKARELAGEHWPGGLTLVVKTRGNKVPGEVRGGGNSVGLRAPAHGVVQELVRELGEGVVAASANFAGERAPKLFEEIDKEFLSSIGLAIGKEAGKSDSLGSSTVVDVSGEGLRILRQGSVGVE